jgi:hypothetical protein
VTSAASTNRWQAIAALFATLLILRGGLAVSKWRRAQASAVSSAGTSAGALTFSLEEVSQAAGIVHRHEALTVHPTISNVDKFVTGFGGAAVAVLDYDKDGWQDVYLTTMAIGAPNRLFANQGDGTFRDVAARVGLADVNRDAGSLRPLFFDFENDGDSDLVLTTTYCPRVFRNDGSRFVDVTAASGIAHCGFASASNVFDFDRDGDQDLIIADFLKPVDLRQPAVYDFMPEAWFNSRNGGPVHVYRNEGDATFTPVPGNLGIDQAGWRGWVHAVGVYDLQGAGGSDIYFAVDFNYADRMFYDVGPGSLRDMSAVLNQKYSHSSMSAEIADFRNTDIPSIFITHIYAPSWVPAKNVMWDVKREGNYHDAADDLGVSRCGWAWGARFADLDNDRWQDLVVTNGFFSGDPKRDYWYQTALLQGGVDNLSKDARQWPPIDGRSMASFEQSCVFMNRGGRFENVVSDTGMRDDRLDGRGVASIDLKNDGSLSLVVANFEQPAELYRNRQRNENHWIGFSLEGTRSGTDAFGTKVTIRLADQGVLTRELRPTNGYLSQSDPRLHFGLGADAKIAGITIRWPSGIKQELSGLALDEYHEIREPSGDVIPRS